MIQKVITKYYGTHADVYYARYEAYNLAEEIRENMTYDGEVRGRLYTVKLEEKHSYSRSSKVWTMRLYVTYMTSEELDNEEVQYAYGEV